MRSIARRENRRRILIFQCLQRDALEGTGYGRYTKINTVTRVESRAQERYPTFMSQFSLKHPTQRNSIEEIKISETPSSEGDTGYFRERGWLGFLCLVCLVVLFSNLGSAALFEPDESRNAEKAREILLLNDWVTPHQNFLPTLDKPIAFYWLVASAFKLFGISEWSARLPSVLAALGCIFLV